MRLIACLLAFTLGCGTTAETRIAATPPPVSAPPPPPAPTPTPTVTPSPAPVATVAPKAAKRPPVPPRPVAAQIGSQRTVDSTAYCLTSNNAIGRTPRHGDVAMNGVPFGSSWYVHDGPYAGATLVVADRIGSGSQFDIWMGCQAMRQYGRRTITIHRVT